MNFEAGSQTLHQNAEAERVAALALETFGSDEKATRWLNRQTTALAGLAPVDLLGSPVGVHRVERLLGRIAYGIAA